MHQFIHIWYAFLLKTDFLLRVFIWDDLLLFVYSFSDLYSARLFDLTFSLITIWYDWMTFLPLIFMRILVVRMTLSAKRKVAH
jgi:hypothetical protein